MLSLAATGGSNMLWTVLIVLAIVALLIFIIRGGPWRR